MCFVTLIWEEVGKKVLKNEKLLEGKNLQSINFDHRQKIVYEKK